MSRVEAVEAMYQDMAARHRARFRSIHVRNFFFFSLSPPADRCVLGEKKEGKKKKN